MRFIIPKMKLCPGQKTRYPIVEHDPFKWIKNENENIIIFNIDGYVVDKFSNITALFKRFEYIDENNDIESIEFNDIKTIISDSELKALLTISDKLKSHFRVIFWPVNYPVNYDASLEKILSISFKEEDDELKIEGFTKINLNTLQSGIRIFRKRSFGYVKPLNAAKTYLECHLANNTSDPWPGDLDGLIYDKKDNKVLAFVEFKTHNIDSPIENEHIGKYGDADWRRFNVLFDLQEKISNVYDFTPKIFFIVWGSKDIINHNNLKIDIIERNKVCETLFFDRPSFDRFSERLFDLLVSKCIK